MSGTISIRRSSGEKPIISLDFKLHYNHIHILSEYHDEVVEKSYPLDAFKLLVTQFLKYYREGETDVSAQVDQVPLVDSFQWVKPGHIKEPENGLFLHRSVLYDFVDENDLFKITYTPPSYTEENIERVRKALDEMKLKEWGEKLHRITLEQTAAIRNLSDPPTKDEVLDFLCTRNNSCQSMPFCIPLIKLTIEMLGGPVEVTHPEWHEACPAWRHCQRMAGGNFEIGRIYQELTDKLENLTGISSECKEAIGRFKSHHWAGDVAEIEQQANEGLD